MFVEQNSLLFPKRVICSTKEIQLLEILGSPHRLPKEMRYRNHKLLAKVSLGSAENNIRICWYFMKSYSNFFPTKCRGRFATHQRNSKKSVKCHTLYPRPFRKFDGMTWTLLQQCSTAPLALAATQSRPIA